MTPAESKLVEFLTSEENMPFTVEILQRRDDIRERALARFWEELKCRIEKTQPAGLSDSMKTFQLRLTDPVTDPPDVKLAYVDPELSDQDHFLGYYLGQEKVGWYYGVWWFGKKKDAAPPKLAKLHELPPVVDLHKELTESMKFGQDGTCMVWLPLPGWESLDQFIASFADAPEKVLNEIADRFWCLVQKTLSDVEEANRAITGK